MTPIDPFTEDHLRQIPSLDLGRDEALNALAKLVGIQLSVTRERDEWFATPRDAPTLTGARHEIVMFVKGYAYGYRGQRTRHKHLHESLVRFLDGELERQDYDLTKRGA